MVVPSFASAMSGPKLALRARCHQTSALPVGARADCAGLLKTGSRRGIGDVLGLDVAIATRLGGHQPDHSVVGQRSDRIDQAVDEIAVFSAPPHKNDGDDILEVLVDQFTTDN